MKINRVISRLQETSSKKHNVVLNYLGINPEDVRQRNSSNSSNFSSFIDKSEIMKILIKKLGKPKIEKEDDQKFYNFKLNQDLKKMKVKQLYIETYKNRSDFLMILY